MAKILLIDDYYESREIVSELLKKSGQEVITANDGEEAINKIQLDKYDLILLDLLLPKINAIDILKELTNKKINLKDTKIIVMYVLGQEEQAQEAIKFGARGKVLKSTLTPNETVKNILQYLENS